MPALCAASITVLPFSIATCLPSISMLTISALHQTTFVFDVMLELTAIMLEHALHRPGCGIAQRANGAPCDVFAQIQQQVQVLRLALAMLDAVHNAVQPAGAFAARRTLAARFFIIKIG